MKLKFSLWLALVISVHAAPYAVDLKFETLTLRNGLKLREVVIKSYDHANGKVVVFADRQMSSIQIELLPEAIAAQIIAIVSEETKDAARQEKADGKTQQKNSTSAGAAYWKRAAEAQARQNAAAQTSSEEAKKARDKENARTKAKSLAYARADRYFRYEPKPGSGHVAIRSRGIQLEEPLEVPGWDRRYRVNGTAGLEYYDSYGRSFNVTTRNFEVIVGPDSNGNIVALDFTTK